MNCVICGKPNATPVSCRIENIVEPAQIILCPEHKEKHKEKKLTFFVKWSVTPLNNRIGEIYYKEQ